MPVGRPRRNGGYCHCLPLANRYRSDSYQVSTSSNPWSQPWEQPLEQVSPSLPIQYYKQIPTEIYPNWVLVCRREYQVPKEHYLSVIVDSKPSNRFASIPLKVGPWFCWCTYLLESFSRLESSHLFCHSMICCILSWQPACSVHFWHIIPNWSSLANTPNIEWMKKITCTELCHCTVISSVYFCTFYESSEKTRTKLIKERIGCHSSDICLASRKR